MPELDSMLLQIPMEETHKENKTASQNPEDNFTDWSLGHLFLCRGEMCEAQQLNYFYH